MYKTKRVDPVLINRSFEEWRRHYNNSYEQALEALKTVGESLLDKDNRYRAELTLKAFKTERFALPLKTELVESLDPTEGKIVRYGELYEYTTEGVLMYGPKDVAKKVVASGIKAAIRTLLRIDPQPQKAVVIARHIPRGRLCSICGWGRHITAMPRPWSFCRREPNNPRMVWSKDIVGAYKFALQTQSLESK